VPTGFQTFNDDGSIDIDITTRLAGFVTSIGTDSNHGGSVAIPYVPTGDFFYCIVPPPGWEGRQPSLVYRDGRVYWYADVTGGGAPAFQLVPCTAFIGWS